MAAPRWHSPWTVLVLLALLAVLPTPAQSSVPLQPNFKQQKFLGTWFTVGLASNSTWFLEKKEKMTMCKSIVVETEDNALNMTITYFRRTQCHTWSFLLQRDGPPGRYRHTSPRWSGTREVSVVETDYERYALLYTQGSGSEGRDFLMATLYTRAESPASEALRKKFTAFTRAQGLTDQSIVFLLKADQCINDHR
ncbi:prostaglandin-H2 D-isomerase [Sorex araneus]|uniref:prostaglandin-H2 D-isomerase n=1 Tax=Sorex araneus TaxID=42254 RepID=UPI0003317E4F|nr:prostaglandin-H2 D-isomerase [Sorex araneus]XP_054980101.1 prostaglandin-H2 D-isomerase [Sorex araneus]